MKRGKGLKEDQKLDSKMRKVTTRQPKHKFKFGKDKTGPKNKNSGNLIDGIPKLDLNLQETSYYWYIHVAKIKIP